MHEDKSFHKAEEVNGNEGFVVEDIITVDIKKTDVKAMIVTDRERSLKDDIRLDPERFGLILCEKDKEDCERSPPVHSAEHPAHDQIDFNEVKYRTGSKYEGEWDKFGMAGEGTYTMPHGVKYVGDITDGVFHGRGKLIYPSGAMIKGVWLNGKLTERKYIFADGLTYDEDDWDYCQIPDRRLYVERQTGMRPAGRSFLTQQVPTREIPPHSYDTGEGFYNPKTKCLIDPDNRRILRVPTKAEEEWIIKHCRKGWDENVGFRPDLYESLFAEELSQNDIVVEDPLNGPTLFQKVELKK